MLASMAMLLSASSTASAQETEPARPEAADRARYIAYATMTLGAAAIATGTGLYAVGTTSTPEGCTIRGCDVRHTNGWPSNETIPCSRNIRQDGCVGSPYNVSRLADAGKAQVMTSAGAITAAIGAVAVAGGFVLWLRTPSSDKAASNGSTVASAHVVPVIGPGSGGVGLVADF
jgi:hypothetical protein